MNRAFKHIIQSCLQHIQAEVSVTGYYEIEEGWSDEQVPDGYRFALVLSGRSAIEMDGVRHENKAGDLVLFPAGKHVRLSHISGRIATIWCQFRANLAETKLFELLQPPIIVSLSEPEQAEQLLRRMLVADQEETLTSRLKVKAALLELLSCYLDHCNLDEAPLRRLEPFAKLEPVLDYIDSHLDKPIAVEELAALTFMHPNYFIEMFKSLIGVSPIHYVNRRKLEFAKKQLEQTNTSVAQIASQIGMQNHYLSRMFKQYSGLAPSQYRKKYDASSKLPQAQRESDAETEEEAGNPT